MVVKEGNANKVVEQFSQRGIIEKQEGFIDLTVMKQKARRGEDEEVLIMMRWKSEEYWKQWQHSDAHIAAHKARRGQPQPDYIISVSNQRYEVQAVKEAR